MKIKLIYLAAGNSRRFNSQRMQNTEPPQSEAENKLLYLLDEKPMFRYLFDRLVKVCQRHPEWEMIVVTQYPEIEHQVKALQENEQQGERFPVKTVISKDSYKGAAYSVKAGIRAAGDADAYAFFVADQPYFTEESVEGFLEKMEREAKVVPGCVTWNGQEGNPVWFPAKYGKELLELEGDAGGRKVFRRYREKAVFYEVSLEKELEDYRPEPKRKELNFTWPEAPHMEKVALAAADLAFHFPDGKQMWPPLTFTLYNGQRVALVGHNGCGKSTLLKLLAGTLERCGGNVVTAPQMRLGYYTQHQMDTLRPDTTVLGEIRRLSDPRTTEEELMSVLGLFLLGQEYFDRQVSKLSGGEKSRLVLASLFLKRCNFLLLDEPTNHLDLESREALGTALQKFDGTLLMVAHDRWLLSQVGAEAWALDEKGITVYPDFASYDTARRAALESGSVSPSLNASNKAEKPDNAPRANLSREEQKRLKREQAERRNALHKELKPLQQKYAALEGELEKAMNEQSDVETQLADPAVYADGARSTELLKRFNELRDLTERLMEDMAALEEQIAAIEARRADIDSMGDLA